MSEYYDHYHRWEPLAEFHFDLNDSDEEYDDENYLYCLCSRAYIRDGVKLHVEKEDGSESDMEVLRDTGSQGWENESHVHFSLDTSYKVKCEKDEGASCYCSASHTDNCCSTDEHDAAHVHGTSHALQPSDSGADLTYQDCHSENTNPEKIGRMDQDYSTTTENYLSEATWDKFWAVNGERLIWASWIKKYSDYINPGYLDENHDLAVDDSGIPKQKSVDQIYKETETKNEDDSMRERKFSYDSKVNPYKKSHGHNQPEKMEKIDNKDESWMPCSRRRSCSEHERIVSPRTLAGTDSMTNVTKITLSSYDVTSSHVTSESTPTDDYSVSSTTSEDQSNDQTRIANVENADPASTDDMDSDQYWQFLWKKHFGEQYALHYANYLVSHIGQEKENELPSINIDVSSPNEEKANKTFDKPEIQEKSLDVECENSEGNSQELPTVIEREVETKVQVQDDITKIEQVKTVNEIEKTQTKELNTELKEIKTKVEELSFTESENPKKRGKKKSNKFLGSVGVLLQNLLKDDANDGNYNETEVTDAGEGKNNDNNKDQVTETSTDSNNQSSVNLQQSASNTNFTSYSYDDGDDEPPEETPINLKRSHEIDHEAAAAEKIKATFQIMGFSVDGNKIPKGQMVFRKRLARLRPPRYKNNNRRFGPAKKIYFDDDGNPIWEQSKDSQEERDMQTDDDNIPCPDFQSEALKLLGSCDQPDSTLSQGNKDQNPTINARDDIVDKTKKKVENVVKPKTEDMNIDIGDNIEISSKEANTSSNVCADVDNREISKDTEKETDGMAKVTDNYEPTVKENKRQTKNKHQKKHKENDSTENISKEGVDTTENVNETVEESKDIGTYDVQNKIETVVEESIAMQASEMPLPDDLDQSSDEKQDTLESSVSQNVESTKRRRRQKRYAKLDEEDLSTIPEELRDEPKMMKYWKKRHSLFHRFDEGIRLDRESWFSVTPESVARHIARKYTYDTVLDAFCGAGGNTIQFAHTSKKVIAIDIDPAKVEMARHNAAVYGVQDRIQFLVGDFFELAPTLEADMVFLSPPWGGPGYSSNAQYDIETMLLPRPASELMSVARTISPTISFYLPRNTRPDQILSLAKEVSGSVEVEQSFLDKRFVAITAYFY